MVPVRVAMHAAGKDTRTALITTDPAGKQKFVDAARQDLAEVARQNAVYASLSKTDAERQLAANMDKDAKAWLDNLTGAVAEVAKNTPEGNAAALDVMLVKNPPISKPIQDTLGALTTENQRAAAEQAADASSAYALAL